MAKQTFTVGQVLTADQMTSLQQTAMGGGSATAKTASYTLVAADAGTTVIINSASSTTITVNTSLFAAGDTVFIVNQGAGVCTITAGTATVSTAGSLTMGQNETGQLYFLSTSAAIFSEYTQSAGSAGAVLQVKSFTKTNTFSTSSTSFTDITDLAISITPTSASNKILVIASVQGAVDYTVTQGYLQLMRGSTAIGIGDTAGSRTRCGVEFATTSTGFMTSNAMQVLDSPATTSATTYKVQMRVGSSTGYVNQSINDTDASYDGRGASTITVMEVTP